MFKSDAESKVIEWKAKQVELRGLWRSEIISTKTYRKQHAELQLKIEAVQEILNYGK